MEKEERQQVNQVGSYTQDSYQPSPRSFNNQGRTQGYQPRPYGSNTQGYQEKPQRNAAYGGYRSSTCQGPPGFSTQGGSTYNQGPSLSFETPSGSQAQESTEPTMKDMIATLVQSQVKSN
ncbi:hypothetical protein M0R45_026250 [Rubus argutus]|uniref:Uncharacterized protein n=1 Tax=Rubus argutus TaxID=59490 RepID=A0AAW1WXM9_RUBAR